MVVVMLVLLIAGTFAFAGGQGEQATAADRMSVEAQWRAGPDLALRYADYANIYSLPLTQEKVTMSIMAATAGTPKPDLNDYRNIQEIEKKTNVAIEWRTVDRNEYAQFYRSVFAAGTDLPAIASVWSNNDVLDYYEAGMLIGLEDLILQHAPNIKHILDMRPTVRKQLYAPDGEIPHLPMMYHDKMVLMGKVRQEWLDKLGLAYPKTITEWERAFRAFTNNDPNGNGQADEYAVYSYHPNYLLKGNFGWLFGLSEVYSDFIYDNDDKVTYYWLMPQAQDAVAFVKKAYQEKWFPVLMLDDFDTFYPERGTWGAKDHGMDWFWAGATAPGWVALVPPEIPGITQYYQTYLRAYNGRSWVVTKDAEDPVLAVKYLDYIMATVEGNTLAWWGFEGEHWYWKEGWAYQNSKLSTGMSDEEWDAYAQKKADEIYSYGERPRIAPEDWGGGNIDASVDPERAASAKAVFDAIAPYVRPNFPSAVFPIGAETDAFQAWGDNGGGSYAYGVPDGMIFKFITGREPMENWDVFIEQLKKLGVMEYQAAGQSMYDRYLNF
jgi:putative aldouronate transport system substrate-binding protein